MGREAFEKAVMRGMPVKEGTYGYVVLAGDTALKRADLFDHDGYLRAPNLNEAVYLALLRRSPSEAARGVVQHVRDVCVDAMRQATMITMDRGVSTFHDWLVTHELPERVGVLWHTLRTLTRALHALHSQGLIHGDVKPSNIIVTNAAPEAFQVRLIDFGSAQMHRRSDACANLCTYAFAPPESFMSAASDSPLTDAYSLGAVLFYSVHRRYLYDFHKHDTFESVKRMHATVGLQAPFDVSREGQEKGQADGQDGEREEEGEGEGAPGDAAAERRALKEVLRIAHRLLDPDPKSRLSIATLFHDLFGGEHTAQLHPDATADAAAAVDDDVVDDVLMRAWGQEGSEEEPRRAAAVHRIFTTPATSRSAPLACSIADKLAKATSSCPTDEEIAACCTIAECVLAPTSSRVTDTAVPWGVRTAVVRVMQALECDVYEDTSDWVLVKEHGLSADSLDMRLLKEAIAASPSVHDHVSYYLARMQQPQLWTRGGAYEIV